MNSFRCINKIAKHSLDEITNSWLERRGVVRTFDDELSFDIEEIIQLFA